MAQRKLLRATKKIREILEKNAPSRDNDYILWYLLALNAKIKMKSISAFQFLKKVDEGVIVPFESARRTRQKLQEHHPELRGKLWDARHKRGEEVAQEIVQFDIVENQMEMELSE